MPALEGEASADIEAPIDEVWAVVEDVLSAPDWQDGLLEADEVERDGEGRVVVMDAVNDGKVRKINSRVRFTYQPPTRLSWKQEKGDVKSVEGAWDLEDLGDGRTRATYSLTTDLGRMLGMVIRGPVVDALRGIMVNGRPKELKQRVEG
jgi:carbon monoxide dehydrogenase subunit G